MRAVSVHPDALVVTSAIWRTNAIALRAGGEAMLVDSPYLPEELEMLPRVLEQSGFRVDALLSTHADYDHLLGRLAFPGLALGVGEPTLMRLREEPGVAQRELRDFDAELYLERPRPLSLGRVESLPVPGKLELGEEELELHPGEGHTADGMIVAAPWLGVVCCGDYLSDVEIPLISENGSLEEYRSTLDRLRPLAEGAEVVVPGHGSPHDRDTALRLLDEDAAYIDRLTEVGDAPLPPGRDTARQQQIHGDNVRKQAEPPGRGPSPRDPSTD